MELARITRVGLDISGDVELFAYSYADRPTKEVIARINLGDATGPIAGNALYVLTAYINGVPVSPSASVQVLSGMTQTVLISKPLPLETGDVLSLHVLGTRADVAVNAVISIRDVTPLRAAELTGSGSVLVDHNYGGPDTLAYKLANGTGVNDADIYVYLKADYDAGRTGADYVLARTKTNVTGRWTQPIMLDPETYTLICFKQGQVGPDRVDVVVA